VNLVLVHLPQSGKYEEIRSEVAAILSTEGVIEKDPETADRYVAIDEQEFLKALDDVGLMVCDFCSSPDVRWLYPAQDFEMYKHQDLHHMSRSGWAACEICHHLIEQRLFQDLNQHAMTSFPGGPIDHPTVAVLVMEAIKANTARFERNRTGPPVPVGGDEGE
jgi:hypothetical protein